MASTVLAIGHRFDDLEPERAVLGELAEVVDGRRLADATGALRAADAVLLGTQAALAADELAVLERCALVVRYGIGADNVDLERAAALGIAVANVPEYCIDDVADHTLALVLAGVRRLEPAAAAARAGDWSTAVMAGSRRLASQTLGLVGYGRIGRAVARRALAFGMHVLAFDPVVGGEALERDGVHPAGLDEVFATADVVSLHCPLTERTRGIAGAARLAQMKPTAWLVNTSRGALVDVDALLAALDAGVLAGAALDVLPTEPPRPGEPVLSHPKVIVTPHVAWYSVDAVRDLRSEAAGTVARALLGDWPATVLNGIHHDHPKRRRFA